LEIYFQYFITGNDEISEAESFCVGKFLEVGDTLWTFLTSGDSNSDELLTLVEYRAFWDDWDFNGLSIYFIISLK
jgi:hypothetical protein